MVGFRVGVVIVPAVLMLAGCGPQTIGAKVQGRASSTTLSKAPPSSTTTTTPTTTTPTTTTPTTTAPEQPLNPSARLTISSTNLTSGEAVTIGGTDCPSGLFGTFTLGPYPYDGSDSLDVANQLPEPDGRWTFTGQVPMIDGPTDLTGLCEAKVGNGANVNDRTAGQFTYSAIAVTVRNPFQLEVKPSTTVSSGDHLIVTPLGGGCIDARTAEVLVSITTPGTRPETLLPVTGSVEFGIGDPRGAWQATLTVPPTLSAGSYQVNAECTYEEEGVVGTYAPVPMIVKAAG